MRLAVMLLCVVSAAAWAQKSVKVSCKPEDLAKMSPREKKMADRICTRTKEKDAQHAKAAEEKQKKLDKFVKGHAGFEQVVKENGNRLPTDSKKVGDTTVWTYMSYTTNAKHSQCSEYVFDAAGDSLKSHRTYPCD